MQILSLLLLISLIVSIPDTSYAYINPGSGSIMLQVIMAVVFGAAVTIKVFWSKIKSFIDSFVANRKKSGNAKK